MKPKKITYHAIWKAVQNETVIEVDYTNLEQYRDILTPENLEFFSYSQKNKFKTSAIWKYDGKRYGTLIIPIAIDGGKTLTPEQYHAIHG